MLRRANFVVAKKQGKFVVYQLDPEVAAQVSDDFKRLDLGCCRLDLPNPAGGDAPS